MKRNKLLMYHYHHKRGKIQKSSKLKILKMYHLKKEGRSRYWVRTGNVVETMEPEGFVSRGFKLIKYVHLQIKQQIRGEEMQKENSCNRYS